MVKYIVFLLVLCSYQVVKAQQHKIENKAEWKEDLAYLEHKIQQLVPTFSTPENKALLSDKVKAMLEEGKINTAFFKKMQVQQILHLIQDDGARVSFIRQEKILPIKSYWFQNELYICEAKEKYTSLVGQKITHINGEKVMQVFKQLQPFINVDGEPGQRHLFQLYWQIPVLLHSINSHYSTKHITIQTSTGKTITLEAEPYQEYSAFYRNLPNNGNWKNGSDKSPNAYYRYQYLKEHTALLVQIKKVMDQPKAIGFKKFVKQIKESVEENKCQKIILDLRYGGGGNGYKLLGLVDFLNAFTRQQKNSLVVLTSRSTKGTLVELLTMVQLNSSHHIIGEPTFEGPNTVSDTKKITLPNSKIEVLLPVVFWKTSFDRDTRKTVLPYTSVAYRYEQYKNQQDPWLAQALAYNKRTIHHSPLPATFQTCCIGTQSIESRKAEITNNASSVRLHIARKIKQFFSVNTGLYWRQDRFASDVPGLFLRMSTSNDSSQFSFKWEWYDIDGKKIL